jgi:hypothetical protein
MYLTHIDDEGNASSAVRVPIEDPDVRTSFNLPEFVQCVPSVDPDRLYEGVRTDSPNRNVKLGSTSVDGRAAR